MMDFKNALVLVTGGAGSIGANLVKKLHENGAKIIVLDNLTCGHLENITGIPDVEFVKGDITDEKILNPIFEKPINYIFHLAASFANERSIESPLDDLNTNIIGTIKLLQYSLKLKNLKRFVLVSSSCIYGNREEILTEELLPHPETPYAISKLSSEYYGLFFHNYYGLPITILRYFNSYGPGEYPGKYRNVIPNFFKIAMSGKPLPITGTGEEIRSFVYVDDIIDGTILASLKSSAIGECFNLSSDNKIKIKDLADKINAFTGNKAGVIYTSPRSWDSIKNRCPSYAKANRILNYNPRVTIDDGLVMTYKWFLELNKLGKL
jgi:UDP-glucose 4-epimerase